MNTDQKLVTEIRNGEIVMRVGINTLKFAFERHDDCRPYNVETDEYEQKWSVFDPAVFAKDVLREIEREEEDGTTPLIAFLDKMCMKALENGSAGIDDRAVDYAARHGTVIDWRAIVEKEMTK